MDYSLPAGVVNTDSIFFYADDTLTFGPLVKEIKDQTLVIIDFSFITPPHTVTGYNFSIDVTSNPALVISYPQLNVTNDVLSFLVSGGIAGQQYNVAITTNVDINARTDILVVSIPSSSGECATINPVPTIYSQLPLGEPTQGYVNSAVRYFWGDAPPNAPNVMDQWYSPSEQILAEWATDGVDYFWQTIMSANLVSEAPQNGAIYGRYNGSWYMVPIQWDAPANGLLWGRQDNSWVQLPYIIPDVTYNGIRYGRMNGTWQPDVIQVDAPSDGNDYARNNNGWRQLLPIIPEAPQNNFLFGRINGGWQPVPIQSDSPFDGSFYGRRNGAWMPFPISGIQYDAPTDGTLYGRQDAAWIAAYPASNPDNYQSDTDLANALAPYMKTQGGVFTGAISAPGLVLPNGPTTLQITGGQQGQILVAVDTLSSLAWAPAPPTEAPIDGTAYARLNGGWTPVASGVGVPEAPQDGTTYVRIDATWAHIIHTDITDWDATINSALAPYALITMVPLGSTSFPLMDGTNAIGTAQNWARADHVHPTDTSRYAASNPSGYQTAAQVTAALAPYALTANVPVASNAAPNMNGTVAPGGSATYSRADHVHPSDTSRLALAGGTMAGVLTLVGNPANNLDAAPKQYVDNSVTNANIDCGTF
jgi:hypothetical protein